MKITYSKEEYEKLIRQSGTKRILIISLIGALIVSLTMLAMLALYLKVKINICLIMTSILFVCFYVFLIILLFGVLKNSNNTNDIIKVEQEITDEYIKEIVYRDHDFVDESTYKYEDVLKTKKDKNNYYLYLTSSAILAVNKTKLENKDKFEEKINSLKKQSLIKK